MGVVRKFDFVVAVETSTLPTLTVPVSSDAGFTTVNDSASSQTIAAGNCLVHPYLNILAPHTYTINGSMLSAQLDIAGILNVNNGADMLVAGEITLSGSAQINLAGTGVLRTT